MSDPSGVLLVVAIFIAALLVYFLPATLAFKNRHPYASAIFLLVLLTGWTGWGWVAALIWAFVNPARRADG